MGSGWIAEIKRHGLPATCSALRIEARGRAWGPCPACSATKRGHDSRAPVGANPGGGWRCHACGAEGDAADLVAYKACGRRLRDCVDGDHIGQVRALAAEVGLCTLEDGEPPRVMPTRRVAPEVPVQIRRVNRGTTPGPIVIDVVPSDPEPDEPGRASGRPPPWDDQLCQEAAARLWDDPEAEPVRKYLMGGAGEAPGGTNGRRLPEEVVRGFQLGALFWLDWWWVTIPLLDPRTKDPINVKMARVPNAEGERPKPKYTSCSGRPLTLFGERALTNDLAGPVIVVEGELDVVAFWAYGYQGSVVSGTAGAGAFRDEWLDVLEPYEQFALAYDVEDSETGEKGAATLADRLGKHRCVRVRMPRKDVSDCWAEGVSVVDVDLALERARPYDGMEVVRLGSMADVLEADIRDPSRLMGLPTGSARLDQLFAGWGLGVTVITGGTKTGKTTLAAWAMREQGLMGVPVLMSAFEQGASPLTQKFLRMQLGGDFTKHTEHDRRAAMAQLDKLPIHLVKQKGMTKLEDWIQTIRFHRRRNRVKLFVLDHIGFLVDLSRKDMDETRQLQHAMRTMVTVANDEEVGIIMIAHPSGGAEREGRRARLFDVKGTVSIQQDCAAGLALEWDGKIKEPHVRVHVDALRKEFGLGTGSEALLWFDPVSCLYADEWSSLPSANLIDPTRVKP